MSTILWALAGGTVIGLLGKAAAPGERDDVPLWLTILCGVGGVVAGNALYSRVFDPDTLGVDWWRHGWQIGVAALLVALVASLTGRGRRHRI